MATYKVVFTRTNTITGYIEADDVQDLSNKLWYPHSLNGDGTINERWVPADKRAFEASENSNTEIVTSAEQVGDTLTSVAPLPDAVKPSGWDE
tara:strand:- start:376 stop:654 length:279 start_codon:yes stop_codon:yes gene_type:complete